MNHIENKGANRLQADTSRGNEGGDGGDWQQEKCRFSTGLCGEKSIRSRIYKFDKHTREFARMGNSLSTSAAVPVSYSARGWNLLAMRAKKDMLRDNSRCKSSRRYCGRHDDELREAISKPRQEDSEDKQVSGASIMFPTSGNTNRLSRKKIPGARKREYESPGPG
ncbi:hypothetical protein B0H17DRAFT_1137715 [Mycena rosella]|uniref:Uncharacterized protein n=1 Tax=Mycena rosella TaxID=1033263 RepID=A0AAD7GEK4_MYCRO|nr:hypothetical protein B0H17DRAFT_1137715 [Mycena rosella]